MLSESPLRASLLALSERRIPRQCPSRGEFMTDRLQQLLDEAKETVQTPQEKEEQRRSFAYGNTKIENPRITWEMIDREAEALNKAAADSSR